jgi:hypothetical protein
MKQLVITAITFGFLSLSYAGCGDNAADQKPLGAFCFRTSECATGLICLKSECSDDLSDSDSMGSGGNSGDDGGTPDGG